MLPHHEGKKLYRDDMLKLLRDLDAKLEGMQRKVRLYGVGGTVMVLSNIRDASKDVDFIVSFNDFRALSGHIAELERLQQVRIDLFPDGDMPDYKLGEYPLHAQKAPFDFKNLELYYLDKIDFVLTKALAGRFDDVEDVLHFVSSRKEVPLDILTQRYHKIVPNPGKEAELKSKFDKFVNEVYSRLK